MLPTKKVGLVEVFNAIKEGLKPADISKKYNVPKQTIQHYTDELKRKGYIKKVGYGVWKTTIKEVPKLPKGSIRSPKNKQIRGHAFIWKIKPFREINWILKLERNKFKKYSLICNKKVARIILEGRKIWLARKSITIYEPRDFFAASSYQAKGKAVFEMDRLIKYLELSLNVKIRPYTFTTSREHYGLIKNELAKQYNDRGEKLIIREKDGKAWLWIDDSHSLNELENNEIVLNRKIQEWYNDHKKLNFEAKPSLVLSAIHQNAKNLDDYAKHLKAHIQSVKKLGDSVEELTKIIKELKDTKKRNI